MRKPGPRTDRGKLSVLGKYIDDALLLAGMSQSDLARAAGFSDSSYISKVMKREKPVDRPALLRWCQLMNCPEWLEEKILWNAGYATEAQRRATEAEESIQQSHQMVLQELEERKRGE